MGYGAFTVVWPYDEVTEIWSYTYLFMDKWAKRKKYYFFYFSRGLEHCGPFISSDISSIETKRWLLPKFDSKILITWAITLCAPGSSTYESLVTVPKIILRKKRKKIFKKEKIFLFLFFCFLKCQWHPQRLEVLQYQGHVRPRSGASTAGPQPWLKQFT